MKKTITEEIRQSMQILQDDVDTSLSDRRDKKEAEKRQNTAYKSIMDKIGGDPFSAEFHNDEANYYGIDASSSTELKSYNDGAKWISINITTGQMPPAYKDKDYAQYILVDNTGNHTLAIATIKKNIVVSARAGHGKTKFILDHDIYKPGDISKQQVWYLRDLVQGLKLRAIHKMVKPIISAMRTK